jgi:hypothetical protein
MNQNPGGMAPWLGLGSRDSIYMEYPANPQTFPVMALANYLNPQAMNLAMR